MSCCAKCENKGQLKKVEASLDADEIDSMRTGFIGDYFELSAVTFRGHGARQTDHVVKLTKQSSSCWLISIYHKELPFDQLVYTVQFNPLTGYYSTRKYGKLTWCSVEFTLLVKPSRTDNYSKLAPGVYRIRNRAGWEELAMYLGVDARQKKAIDELLDNNNRGSYWPALFTGGAVASNAILSAEVVDIPNWKDDSRWK